MSTGHKSVYIIHMTRVNVYIPNDLAERAKGAGLNVSALTQGAIASALAAQSTDAWLLSLERLIPTNVSHQDALKALDAGREEASTRHG